MDGLSTQSARRWYWAALLVVPIVAVLIFWNFAGVAHTLSLIPRAGQVSDPYYWRQVDLADPYAWDWVRWSPPAVWLWHHAMAFLPLVMLASLASLLLLPWRVALVALLLWPFWEGLIGGSLVVFVVVVAWNALESKRWAIVAYVVIFALVPRPFMLPVLAVLLWRHPSARWALIVSIAGVMGYSLAMGQLGPWLGSLSTSVTQDTVNLSPTALVGSWWLVVGVPLSAFLTWKGWYGLASLAISPYLLMSYLLFALLDLRLAAQPLDPEGEVERRLKRPSQPEHRKVGLPVDDRDSGDVVVP